MEYFTAIFALVIGAASIWMSQKLIRTYFAVRKWNKVEAKILSKEVFYNKRSTSQRSPYGIKVEYSYQYNGRGFIGNICFLVELIGGWKSFMKSSADKKIKEIQSVTPIYVNPKDPNQSVMYVDGIVMYLLVFAMGIFSILFGVSKLF